MSNVLDIPRLKGDALRAAEHRDGHLQIIAAAGAGKTEVVSQRVAGLLADGLPPASIVAFTFTERAAASLKSRIERRVSARLGEAALDRLSGMFVGTIHSFCFRLLQQHVPWYETFDVLDDHKLTAFLTREAYRVGIVPKLERRLFRGIRTFAENLNVVESELLQPSDLEDPFREVYEAYLATLQDNRYLTYGQIVTQAVRELVNPDVFEAVHGPLRHLIVDEYQDINPAQEALIKRLAASPVHLCVVGDDDQSIYQWRGSDVENIVGFAKRYRGVERFTLEKNRRSRPGIIAAANSFATTIKGRIPKTMAQDRTSTDRPEVVCWTAETEAEEAEVIARAIRSAHDDLGYLYLDMAVLCRGRVSFPRILEALEAEGIPVQPGGRTALFLQRDAELFGRTMCWLADYDWKIDRYGQQTEAVTLDDLVERYAALHALSPAQSKNVRQYLLDWRERVNDERRPANLVRDLYDLLGELGVDKWDLGDPWTANRLGTIARCSQLLVDMADRVRSLPHQPPLPRHSHGEVPKLARFHRRLRTWSLRRIRQRRAPPLLRGDDPGT